MHPICCLVSVSLCLVSPPVHHNYWVTTTRKSYSLVPVLSLCWSQEISRFLLFGCLFILLAIHLDTGLYDSMYGVGVYMLRSEIQNGILPGVHLIGLPGHWLRHQPNDCSSRILPITWTVVFTAEFTYAIRGADVGVRGHCLVFLITIH